MKKKAVFNWSGGKDSAHALLKALESGEYEIISLLTTTNRETGLSTMHNIPLDLLQAQSRSIGIPLEILELKPRGNMSDYTAAMENAVKKFKRLGVSHFIYGDIFLHDIRRYREELLHPLGMEVAEPLWGPTSEEVIESYLHSGLKTLIVTTMANGLGEAAIGKLVDRHFIENLPKGVDPNGENGEYHTFCYDGPIFSFPIQFKIGKPFKESHDIKMEDGSIQTFSYYFGPLSASE